MYFEKYSNQNLEERIIRINYKDSSRKIISDISSDNNNNINNVINNIETDKIDYIKNSNKCKGIKLNKKIKNKKNNFKKLINYTTILLLLNNFSIFNNQTKKYNNLDLKNKMKISKENIKTILYKKDFEIIDGEVPIISYHGFNGKKYENPIRQRYQISIEDFNKQLKWLYKNNFETIPLNDYLNNDFSKLSYGKKPIIITADDSFYEQFIAYKKKDSLIIDKKSMIGALFEFEKKHKNFGHYVTLFIDFDNTPFGQKKILKQKLEWLIDHDIIIGTHTWHHKQLNKLSTKKAIEEIAMPYVFLEKIIGVKTNNINLLAYPYSIAPNKKILDMIKKRGGIEFKNKFYKIDYMFLAKGKKFLSNKNIQKNKFKIIRKEIYKNNISKILNNNNKYLTKIPYLLKKVMFYAH